MWERVIDGPVLNFIKNVSFGHDKIVLIPTKLRGLWLTNQLYNLKRLSVNSSLFLCIGANVLFLFGNLTILNKHHFPLR